MIEKIIAENLNIDVNTIESSTHFIDDLGADSLSIVEIVMAIEEEYDIEIPDEDAETLLTVGDVKKYIVDNS